MSWSIKAILARFDGNLTAAMGYCSDISAAYPALYKEYMFYFNELLSLSGSRI
jgi:hypothetical protein